MLLRQAAHDGCSRPLCPLTAPFAPESLRSPAVADLCCGFGRHGRTHMLTLHVGLPGGQDPQSSTVRDKPQLSIAVSEPHWALFREQNILSDSDPQPQTFGVPSPPHVCPVGQDPMLHCPPHSSEAPHALPAQLGVQPHTFIVPPPPHV